MAAQENSTLLVPLAWIHPAPAGAQRRESSRGTSSRTSPGRGLVLKFQARYLQPARETEPARSIPGLTPAASRPRQTCAAVHRQMSFDNSDKKRRGGGKRPEYQQRVSHFLSSAAALDPR